MSTIVRSCSAYLVLVVCLVLVQAAAPARAQSIAQCKLSDAIQVSSGLQVEVERMLRSSATFRSQYRRIAEARSVVVGVRVDPGISSQDSFRAKSIFRRYSSGLIVADVIVGPGSRQAEWIAHEFEHIIEQLDGLNLGALAHGRSSGVWYSGEETIETSRAVHAGRAVREEMLRPIRQPDIFVGQ